MDKYIKKKPRLEYDDDATVSASRIEENEEKGQIIKYKRFVNRLYDDEISD